MKTCKKFKDKNNKQLAIYYNRIKCGLMIFMFSAAPNSR